MHVEKENTQWIFILTSSSKPEDRHLNDIIFGIKVLLKKGVPIENISVIINDDKSKLIQKMAPLITENTHIYKYSDMASLLLSLQKNNIFIVVTGHGSIEGIDSIPPIKPYDFFNTIQKNAKASRVFILLGQCYAGIFNFLRGTKYKKKDGSYSPHIIVIGAAKITTSISLPSEYDNVSWYANIVLLSFFKWIENPKDIDGDNIYSFVDAFKYITYATNNLCYKIEKSQYIQTIQLMSQYKKLKKSLDKIPDEQKSLDDKLKKEAIKEMKKILQRAVIHQEVWILNPLPALKTNIKL